MPRRRRREYDKNRDPRGWFSPEVCRRLADIHDVQNVVPLHPLGKDHAPTHPDLQCFWCLGFFGPGRPKAGETWSGYEVCRWCADTVDARRVGK